MLISHIPPEKSPDCSARMTHEANISIEPHEDIHDEHKEYLIRMRMSYTCEIHIEV